jgi:hypothetical protein
MIPVYVAVTVLVTLPSDQVCVLTNVQMFSVKRRHNIQINVLWTIKLVSFLFFKVKLDYIHIIFN